MIQIANAPCSWGALEFDLEGESPGYLQVLEEMKQTGYAGTELGDWGFMPTDPVKLGKLLQGYDLQLLGAFVPVALADPGAHESGVNTALKTAEFVITSYSIHYTKLYEDHGRAHPFPGPARPDADAGTLRPPGRRFHRVLP